MPLDWTLQQVILSRPWAVCPALCFFVPWYSVDPQPKNKPITKTRSPAYENNTIHHQITRTKTKCSSNRPMEPIQPCFLEMAFALFMYSCRTLIASGLSYFPISYIFPLFAKKWWNSWSCQLWLVFSFSNMHSEGCYCAIIFCRFWQNGEFFCKHLWFIFFLLQPTYTSTCGFVWLLTYSHTKKKLFMRFSNSPVKTESIFKTLLNRR